MKRFPSILGLALTGLCLVSCDNKDKTIAELTGKLMDMQMRVGALEAMEKRVSALESMGHRISALEGAEKRFASLDSLQSRVASLESLNGRVSALENLQARVSTLETLPARVRAMEGLPQRVAALESAIARINEVDNLNARVAVLEERVRMLQQNQDNPGGAVPEPTPLQRSISLLEEYSLIDRSRPETLSFLSHVARVQHGDATMADYPILTELLSLGEPKNTVPMSCVRIFVDGGADVNAADDEGKTPLMAASAQADPTVVRYLLEHGASAKAVDAAGEVAIWYVLDSNCGARRAEVVRLLCNAGCDVNARLGNGRTPLLEAVCLGADLPLVQALVELGADVNAGDSEGASLMDYLQKSEILDVCSEETVQYLLSVWEAAHIQ